MKKTVITALITGFLSSSTWGNDQNADKASLIQQLYAEEKAAQGKSPEWILDRYLSPALRSLIDEIDESDAYCVDFNPVWDSQDPEYDVEVRTTIEPDGKVKASFGQYDKLQTVYFDVDCHNGNCMITDIYHYWENQSHSWQKVLATCLSEWKEYQKAPNQ